MQGRLRWLGVLLLGTLWLSPACTAVLSDDVACATTEDCAPLGAFACDGSSGRCVPVEQAGGVDADGLATDPTDTSLDAADSSEPEQDTPTDGVDDALVDSGNDALPPCEAPCEADVAALAARVSSTIRDSIGPAELTLATVITPGSLAPDAALARYAELARAADSRTQRLTFSVDRRLLTACEQSACATFTELSGLGHGTVLDTTGELAVDGADALRSLQSRLTALGGATGVLAGDCTGLAGLEVMEEAGFLAWYEPQERCLIGGATDLERETPSRCAGARERCTAPLAALGLRDDAVWRPGSRSLLLATRPTSWSLPWTSGRLVMVPGMGPLACAAEQTPDAWPDTCALTDADLDAWAAAVLDSTTSAPGGPPRVRATTLSLDELATVPGAAYLAASAALGASAESVISRDLDLLARYADEELTGRSQSGLAGVWYLSFGPLLATTKVWLFLHASRNVTPARIDGLLFQSFERVDPPESCVAWTSVSGANVTTAFVRDRPFTLVSADERASVTGSLSASGMAMVGEWSEGCDVAFEGSGIERFGEP
jgi:hypothetical protein